MEGAIMARQKFGRLGYQATGFLAIVLVLCGLLAAFPTQAFATSKTADEAIAWARGKVGEHVGYDDGSGYYQCVEFIQAYYVELGVSQVSGNGCDYSWNALPDGWTRIEGGVPQKGDILVYGSSSASSVGHVAIYESDSSLYDQDGSKYGAAVEHHEANYLTYTPGYWGCIHPNFRHVSGWAKENGSWYYYENDGTLRKNAWIKANGTYYYLGADGRIVTKGWAVYKNQYFFVGADGKVVYSQWVTYDGKYYYIDRVGAPVVSDWVKSGGKYYYLDASGNPVVNGWVKYRGSYYYMNANGNPVTNDWVQYNGTWYHFNGSGVCDKKYSQTDALTAGIKSAAKSSSMPVFAYSIADFDGDGTSEAFVIVGNEDYEGAGEVRNGQVWFVSSGGSVSKVDTPSGGFLNYNGTLGSGTHRLFSTYVTAHGSGGTAYVYTVRNGSPVKVGSDIGNFNWVYSDRTGRIIGEQSEYTPSHNYRMYELAYNESTNKLVVVADLGLVY